MQALLYCCCGVDVHDEMIETCILKGFEDEPEIIRKQFQTKPKDLKGFAMHLMEHECFNVSMESTGVFSTFRYAESRPPGVRPSCRCILAASIRSHRRPL